MTTDELKVVFEEQVQRCREVLLQKGKEYTPDEADRFSSFKTAASLQHTSPANALLGMLSDALNYLFILSAIIKEEKRDQKN